MAPSKVKLIYIVCTLLLLHHIMEGNGGGILMAFVLAESQRLQEPHRTIFVLAESQRSQEPHRIIFVLAESQRSQEPHRIIFVLAESQRSQQQHSSVKGHFGVDHTSAQCCLGSNSRDNPDISQRPHAAEDKVPRHEDLLFLRHGSPVTRPHQVARA